MSADLDPGPQRLRRTPQQQRSREKLRRLLDAADELLAREGASALNTVRIAEFAEMSVASLYRYFPDKEAIAEALALRYWRELADLVERVAETAEREPLADPLAAVLDALAAGFRARLGFLALWYSGHRTERVRDVTRATRHNVGDAVQRIIGVYWPDSAPELRGVVAGMSVLIGDGLLREAFRINRNGDPLVLSEGRHALRCYVIDRLGAPSGDWGDQANAE
jgi:AcrR family transcriptional regulator